MKKLIAVCLAIMGIFAGSSAHAVNGTVKGKVEFIRTHDATQIPRWSPPAFWFTLKGVSKAGACPKWVEGKVLFVAKDRQAFDLVLAALNSGKEVAVAFNDEVLASGWCASSYITVGSPPPLY
ncbi:MAG: hypothetical protein WCI06_08005 [Methylococcaceae bacterium]